MHSNGNKLLSYNLWLFSALVTFCECLVCDVDCVEVVLLLHPRKTSLYVRFGVSERKNLGLILLWCDGE